jgi:hypothetical protein
MAKKGTSTARKTSIKRGGKKDAKPANTNADMPMGNQKGDVGLGDKR